MMNITPTFRPKGKLRRRMNIDIMNALLKKSDFGIPVHSYLNGPPIPRPWMPPWQVGALEMIKRSR